MNAAISALGALACLSFVATTALADAPKAPPDSTDAAADEAPPQPAKPTPKPTRKKESLPALPVKLSIVATTPDPPWRLRIENTGDSRIRIPADRRLLSLDLASTSTKSKKTVSCSAPAGMRPSSFPRTRELYLDPGDAWEEELDPRLYCFGATTDLLREGVTVTPRFGFGKFSRGSFAAQGTDRPEAFASQVELTGDALTLPGLPPPAPPPSAAEEKKQSKKDDGHRRPPPAPPPDRNAESLEIFVGRFSDAGNPRDLVLTIRASNEGRRALATVVRGRMLSFHVEELGTDNRAIAVTDCHGQDNPHAIPIEAVSDMRPGREIRLPILVAEVCPRVTFARPGLYRITAILDTTASGEIVKVDPLVATTLARQSNLARVWASVEPFYTNAPMTEKAAHAPKEMAAGKAAGPGAARDDRLRR